MATIGRRCISAIMAALIARMDVPEIDWIGTSLGGILGMTMAAQPNTPIRKLVVNDVGAFIDKAALARISGYVGTGSVVPQP